ncbi:hypothetical protein AAHA92_10017 [Salvia divinorum]|uniref:Uncharacterized protein n=1 Tax=Salvia divinorum TaxID=28513 RepID=A0ABD1HT93_SALDI
MYPNSPNRRNTTPISQPNSNSQQRNVKRGETEQRQPIPTPTHTEFIDRLRAEPRRRTTQLRLLWTTPSSNRGRRASGSRLTRTRRRHPLHGDLLLEQQCGDSEQARACREQRRRRTTNRRGGDRKTKAGLEQQRPMVLEYSEMATAGATEPRRGWSAESGNNVREGEL